MNQFSVSVGNVHDQCIRVIRDRILHRGLGSLASSPSCSFVDGRRFPGGVHNILSLFNGIIDTLGAWRVAFAWHSFSEVSSRDLSQSFLAQRSAEVRSELMAGPPCRSTPRI